MHTTNYLHTIQKQTEKSIQHIAGDTIYIQRRTKRGVTRVMINSRS
jgi:hypothetical protein